MTECDQEIETNAIPQKCRPALPQLRDFADRLQHHGTWCTKHKIPFEKNERDLAKIKSANELELASKDQKISELKGQLELDKTKSESAVEKAVQEKNMEIAKLQNDIELEHSKWDLKEKSISEKHIAELKRKDDEIAYYKDLKSRQSTKMVGESL